MAPLPTFVMEYFDAKMFSFKSSIVWTQFKSGSLFFLWRNSQGMDSMSYDNYSEKSSPVDCLVSADKPNSSDSDIWGSDMS